MSPGASDRGVTGVPARWNRAVPPPQPGWAGVEVALALFVIAAGLAVPGPLFLFGSTPWLALTALVVLRGRRSGWRSLGLDRPAAVAWTVKLGTAVGIGYQIVGTYALEPLIARLTGSGLPDVSAFRSIVGNERQLLFWVAVAWIVAALLEEISFRGWLMTRAAELGRYRTAAWLAGLLLSSAVFGAVHLYQGLSGIIATGVTGLVFGVLYLATGRNLWACIIAHGVLDTAGFVMMYFGVYPGI
jgi:membrane protease YdiL (CAAX protease family)